MIDPIRRLLDRPLAPAHARAVLALAVAVTFGLAVLVCLGAIDGPTPADPGPRVASMAPTKPAEVGPPAASPRVEHGPSDSTWPEQDPQDRRGTPAYRRGRRELREHRALQHLPFRGRGVSISLVGADHGRAVIRIAAETISRAKRRWRLFLRHWSDPGTAYVPRFAARSHRPHHRPARPGSGKSAARRRGRGRR